MAERTTIIDFLEKYTRLYSEHVYLKEKPGEEWIEITYEQTREEAWRIGAGLMALGVEKGENCKRYYIVRRQRCNNFSSRA